ncbi:MAG: isopentenyl-diphosphate Delta-isomerase [Bacteroidales bacterium]|nr:isopentenyl-diphosphate Delta-isomerase [Bacteroidales bacterium]MBN2818356.1 isopentenyl-diphosphate Delta-isomerase [Bacteroidales bacterium]
MEKVILVDKNDLVVGEMEKMDAHIKAKLHRAVSVFIFNTDKQLLLQRRALSKYHSPGLWTNTACTHPRPNETNENAAIRRLREEMGIDESKLTKAFNFIYKEKLDNELTEYEFDHVFVGFSDATPVPEPNEVCEFKYVEAKTLLEDVKKSPQNYTVWFKKIIERVLHFTEQN